MPHIESLIQTQRIMCLKKYVEDYKCPWKSILSHYLKNQGGKFLLHCNFNITDLSKNLLIFYRECLDAWANLNVTQIDSRDHVLNQILWNNQYLRIGDKPQFCKKVYAEGITHFKDILSSSGKLMPWQHFKEKGVSSCDYLLLIGLSKALPDTWKAPLKSYTANTTPQTASNPFTIAEFSLNHNGANINLNKLTSHKLYWILVEQIRVYPTAKLKYESLFNDQNLDWKEIYLIPHKITLDIRTRIFQYKLLNRVLYTNNLLYKMKLSETPLCTFCGLYEESPEHLFFYCHFSTSFWMQTVNWLKNIDLKTDKLDVKDVILGFTKMKAHWTLFNHIIIVGKQTIYFNRSTRTNPTLPQLIEKLKYIEHIEYSIANRNDRLKFHNQKWKVFNNFLSYT